MTIREAIALLSSIPDQDSELVLGEYDMYSYGINEPSFVSGEMVSKELGLRKSGKGIVVIRSGKSHPPLEYKW